MRTRSKYKLFLWMVVLSGLAFAAVLGVTSYRAIRADQEFVRMVLEENKIFVGNALRFGHGVMRSMGTGGYENLLEQALQSKFIGYLAVLNAEGGIIAQTDPPPTLDALPKLDQKQLKDGGVVRETEAFLFITYKAEKDAGPNQRRGPMGRRRTLSNAGDWYLVGLDISAFQKHHHNVVVQTVFLGGAALLFGVLILLFFGAVQRYELAHHSIERLNRIKDTLSKFVPETARTMIEANPDQALLDKYIQDASVLFLDIEGFSNLVQTHPVEQINRTVEAYFSIFFDILHRYGGDINETAGDGMMVIFLDSQPLAHARNAVHAALEIQEHTRALPAEKNSNILPIKVNIGISSGEVYLGSTKMRGTEGDRWTFTASGQVTILAARLSDHGHDGRILLGEETARRVNGQFSMVSLGKPSLKNLKDHGEIYQVAHD